MLCPYILYYSLPINSNDWITCMQLSMGSCTHDQPLICQLASTCLDILSSRMYNIQEEEIHKNSNIQRVHVTRSPYWQGRFGIGIRHWYQALKWWQCRCQPWVSLWNHVDFVWPLGLVWPESLVDSITLCNICWNFVVLLALDQVCINRRSTASEIHISTVEPVWHNSEGHLSNTCRPSHQGTS